MSRGHGGGFARHALAPPEGSSASRLPKDPHAPTAGDGGAPAAPSNLALGAGAPLDPAVRADMEARFGHSFADVRVHDDERGHRSAAGLEAKAYARGNDVAFAEGRYRPRSPDGKRLLAHELAHVVQQRRGGAAPSPAPDAPHEIAAQRSAAEMAAGSGPVRVAGATGVGVAREPDEEKKKREEEAGPVGRVGPKPPKIRRSPKPVTITDPNKATGVLGEVTTPFDLYRGPEWNHLGGGAETASSRTSLARKTRWGDTGGFDNLVQHRTTRRLIIGEQKRLGTASFTNATATTTNLEKNLANTVDKLRANIKSGRVHPAEVANVQDVIARLEQTARAVRNQTSLPEEVVFELTATGGKSTRIGKDYIRNLSKKYKPEFVEHLLERTYVRDPKLAKAMGRAPGGARGTNSDPDIVRAKDVLTPEARSELERLLAGKSPKEWAAQKQREKQAEKQARADEAKRAKEADKARRAAERERIKAEAKKVADAARQKKLEELREAARKSGAPEPATKGEKRLADNQLKKQATQAGKEAQKKFLEQAKAKAKAQPAPKAQAAAPAEAPKPAAPVEAPKAAAPVEAPKSALPVETPKPSAPLELAPKGLTPKGVAKGAVGAAGALAAVAGVKDIAKDVKEGHYLAAAGKTTLLGLSFVGEAAPPLFALGAIMNYWGPRHEMIQKDAFDVGDAFAHGARHVPLLGRSETFRNVIGGLAAAEVAVSESIYYTGQDMVAAVGEGAEIVAGAAEDAWDWLTEGPSMFDLMRAEIERRRGE